MKSARPVVERRLPDAAALAAFTDVDPLMARVFATRGVMSPEELDYGLSRLAPVSKLRNVEAAVDLIEPDGLIQDRVVIAQLHPELRAFLASADGAMDVQMLRALDGESAVEESAP